jgi:hypothetical protein
MEDGKTSYDRAKREFNKAREIQQDMGAGHPDGSLLRVTRLQREAFEAYRVALMTYNSFVVDGELPEESPEIKTDRTGAS